MSNLFVNFEHNDLANNKALDVSKNWYTFGHTNYIGNLS